MQCQLISCVNEPWSLLNYSNDLRLIIIIIYDFTHTHTHTHARARARVRTHTQNGYMRYKEMENSILDIQVF